MKNQNRFVLERKADDFYSSDAGIQADFASVNIMVPHAADQAGSISHQHDRQSVKPQAVDRSADFLATAQDGVDDGSPSAIAADLETLTDYLTDGYWNDNFDSRRSFDIAAGGTLTVDIGDLTGAGKRLAKWALDAWTDVSGINFVTTGKNADITFDDNRKGAYSTSAVDGMGEITSSHVNVSTQWLSYSGSGRHTYSMQTYIHEIGHALGLGHAGNYNGSATYSDSLYFDNDSWQASVMSYFSQDENWNVSADQAFVMTPMMSDILAIRELYGTVEIKSEDSVYSFKSDFQARTAQTIVDTGGTDTLDFSWSSKNQTINLNDETYSNINGVKGNLGIARDTVIEIAIGGKGNDTITGNEAANALFGGGGKDTLTGGGGEDFFIFDTAGSNKNVDTIVDFTVGTDTIALNNNVFSKIGVDGALLSDVFSANSAGVAQDADDRLIYDTDSGALFYDANGNKQGGAVLIARLEANLNLHASDFLVI